VRPFRLTSHPGPFTSSRYPNRKRVSNPERVRRRTAPPARGLVDRARRNLQQRMALDSIDETRIVSVEEVEWSDTSLDCPDPEMTCRREDTPGFRIVLEAAGRIHEYHSDTAYSITLCKDGRPARSGS